VVKKLERVTGGDPACWLERVCAECGALVEGELPAKCWRCGVEVTAG
jgi:rubrerythrin